jgi:hypothetical protein
VLQVLTMPRKTWSAINTPQTAAKATGLLGFNQTGIGTASVRMESTTTFIGHGINRLMAIPAKDNTSPMMASRDCAEMYRQARGQRRFNVGFGGTLVALMTGTPQMVEDFTHVRKHGVAVQCAAIGPFCVSPTSH